MKKAIMIVVIPIPFLALILPSVSSAVSERYLAGRNQGLNDAQQGIYNGCEGSM
jgi:hypothetical protein